MKLSDPDGSHNSLKGEEGVAFFRLAESYSENVHKIAMLVWDTDLLSWVKFSGSDPTAPTSDVNVTNTVTVNVSKTALTASSPTAATVGVASAQAVASNSSRKGLILVNTSANYISLGLGATAVLNSGITLAPYGTFVMDEFCFTTGAVNAIASAASSNLAIQEYT